MCLLSWEGRKKGAHLNFFRRDFGVKKGVPNGPFSATEILVYCFYPALISGWPRFGSVRLRFGDGTVRAVPVFGSRGSSKEGVFVCFSTV